MGIAAVQPPEMQLIVLVLSIADSGRRWRARRLSLSTVSFQGIAKCFPPVGACGLVTRAVHINSKSNHQTPDYRRWFNQVEDAFRKLFRLPHGGGLAK